MNGFRNRKGLGIDGISIGIFQHGGNGAFQLAGQLRSNVQHTVFIGFIQSGFQEEVLHMGLRHGIQVHIPEDTGEAPEVLVLDPAGTGPLVNFHGQLILALYQIVVQLEFRGSER